MGREMLPCQDQHSRHRRIATGGGPHTFLKMQVSPILILILQEIMVVCILNHTLSLGGFFLLELGTQLEFDRSELVVLISWESSHGRPHSH